MNVFEHWCPVTSDFGLIQIDPETIAQAYFDWTLELKKDPRRSEVRSSLADAFGLLPPLSMGFYRTLLVPTRAGWTAYFASGMQGSDPSGAMSVFTKQFGVLSMRIFARNGSAGGDGTIWSVFAPEAQGGEPPLLYRRAICAADDGGWVFEQSGEPFPFENRERYTARRKRDRFDRELLRTYLREFGLDPFSDDFYVVNEQSPAICIEKGVQYRDKIAEYTLDEARTRLLKPKRG
jgi:hypothetical protein